MNELMELSDLKTSLLGSVACRNPTPASYTSMRSYMTT